MRTHWRLLSSKVGWLHYFKFLFGKHKNGGCGQGESGNTWNRFRSYKFVGYANREVLTMVPVTMPWTMCARCIPSWSRQCLSRTSRFQLNI